jgi:hypothetical protein
VVKKLTAARRSDRLTAADDASYMREAACATIDGSRMRAHQASAAAKEVSTMNRNR